jgi:hypothetical protein
MADASQRGYCGSCQSEVVAVKNCHRTRNTSAANFAAANFALVSFDSKAMGPTGPYLCPHCGVDVKVGRKQDVFVPPGHMGEPTQVRLESDERPS